MGRWPICPAVLTEDQQKSDMSWIFDATGLV
jgi:hypothetical protein